MNYEPAKIVFTLNKKVIYLYGKNTVCYKKFFKKPLKFNKVQSKQIIYLNNLLFV